MVTTTLTSAAAGTTAAQMPTPRAAAAPSAISRTARYALHTTRMTLTNVPFTVFTVAMPVGMYLLFGMMFGQEGGGDARGMIMVNMAAYGGLGAAVTAGTQIQEDQRSGFLRQLIVAGLSPRSFLPAHRGRERRHHPRPPRRRRGRDPTGVEASPGRFLLTLVVLWLGLLPTILIGLVLGMVLRGAAAMAGGVVTMMAMAIFGGLWMPLEMFPQWMQELGRLLPTYWISSLGEWSLQGAELPVAGLVVIGVWTLVLGALCLVSMSRAVGLRRR